MESVFRMNSNFRKRNDLRDDMETEVCIIGAGICGILTAHRLMRRGINPIILEAESICSGETGSTTAKINAHHGSICDFLIKRYGFDAASEYVRENLQSVEDFRQIAEEEHIDCDLVTADNYLYSDSKEELEMEAAAARLLGLDASFTENVTLPFETAGAVKVKSQAHFNALKFLSPLSDMLEIYENTRVTAVKGNTVFTEKATVKAAHIVFACHFPIVNFPGMYFARMHTERSYVLALETAFKVNGMYIGTKKDSYSLREYNGLLLFGGKGHRTGKKQEDDGFAPLEEAAEQYFGTCGVVAKWSAQDCMPSGKVPYIGRYSKRQPNHYVATGFGKWGMTSAMTASRIICDEICKNGSYRHSVFLPNAPKKNRFSAIASHNATCAVGLAAVCFDIPFAGIEKLGVGEGGIVMHDGKRLGVYRESENKYYAVDPVCTHLHCRLNWNSEEKTWDCPCHGSRFDYHGKLITNPAAKNLKNSCIINGQHTKHNAEK